MYFDYKSYTFTIILITLIFYGTLLLLNSRKNPALFEQCIVVLWQPFNNVEISN